MTRSDAQTLGFRPWPGLVAQVTRALTAALSRRRGRQVLAQLDSHLLRDIGLSPDETRTECAKPFWQP